jgi:response regulator RpfG family c-di-GMP phosphodiesterase
MLKPKNSKPKVLLIDDDELSTHALAKRLRKREIEAKVLTRPTEAMDSIRTEKVDLILLDIVMPEMDGLALLKEIRKKHGKNELPVLMLTGVSDSFEISEAFRLGANDYISKPINMEALIARIFGQLSGIELMNIGIRKREREVLNSLVVTYHHEINNPLAILLGKLQLLDTENPKIDSKDVAVMIGAVERVVDILASLKALKFKGDIKLQAYMGDTKMVDTPKRKRG